jgi:hypothetical protein
MHLADTTNTTWEFVVRSEVVVVGWNDENADIDHPRGEVHGLVWLVQARNEYGDTKELAVLSGRDPEAAAKTLAERLNVRMSRGLLPVGFSIWPAGRPIYGSYAYLDYGQSDDLEFERNERDC